MSNLASMLVALTSFRDRDELYAELIKIIDILCNPLEIAIYQHVPLSHFSSQKGSGYGWVMLLKRNPNHPAGIEHISQDTANCIPDSEFPFRLQAMRQREHVEVPGPNYITVWSIASEYGLASVIELHSVQALNPDTLSLISHILQIVDHFFSLLDYAERDTLTGLLNRKTFEQTFNKVSQNPRLSPQVIDQERRQQNIDQTSFWLGVVDIDHFKQVNDSCGHLIGDEVLLRLSRLMRNTFRATDRLYRFGGEEFVVLLKCQKQSDVHKAFDRLRNNVQQYDFPRVGRVTISIGFSAIKASDTPSLAFERADKAVYYAKDHGRNCVCCYASLLKQNLISEKNQTSGEVELFNTSIFI